MSHGIWVHADSQNQPDILCQFNPHVSMLEIPVSFASFAWWASASSWPSGEKWPNS